MEKRFKALRFMGTLYKILGVINGVATLILAVGICAVSVLGGAGLSDFAGQYGVHGPEILGALGGVLLGGCGAYPGQFVGNFPLCARRRGVPVDCH